MQESRLAAPLKRGSVLTVTVEKIAFEGRALARVENMVVFIDGAVPGDVAEIEVYRTKKQYAEARVIRVVESSASRVTPRCRHFGPCGGCKWQHLSYDQQLIWKREHVQEAFQRIGGFSGIAVRETVPAREQFFYRNKMEYSFGERRWLLPEELGSSDNTEHAFALGLHVPGRYDRILSIDECHLQSPQSNAILNATREFFLQYDANAFSTDTHSGVLRHLVIREGKRTGERMVFLITSPERQDLIPSYAGLLRDPAFGVTTFVHGISSRKSTVALSDEDIVYFGEGIIRERIGTCTFVISPTSFFQTNSLQAELLYELAAEYAELRRTDLLWDLYCGTGSISLFVAHAVSSVHGVELNEFSIANAKANALLNGVKNAAFECGDIRDFARNAVKGEKAPPDVIILDPPRAGLHPDVVRAVGALGKPRMVYVSCNPATSARDCKGLAEFGYNVEEITPVDMFPHTYHIECVIKLRR